jgi:5-methylcytosine-specific restriction protein B
MNEKELFQNISQENILKAIQEIDEKGIQKGRHSSTYDLIRNGKTNPPKDVMRLAYQYEKGEHLWEIKV